MNARDLLALCFGNLWRMKLRTALTVSGVVIAIAAFTAMLSFGAGMQETFSTEFYELGLLSTMNVFPSREGPDDAGRGLLDDRALTAFSSLPGVASAYPFDSIDMTVSFLDTVFSDTTLRVEAQALPATAARTPLYSRMAVGEPLRDDAARDALVTHMFLRRAGLDAADSLIGRRVVVSVEVASVDSGLVRMLEGQTHLPERIGAFLMARNANEEAGRRMVGEEIRAALGRFLDGYLQGRAVIRDTLTIRGMLDFRMGGPFRVRPLIVPAGTVRRLSSGSLIDDPTDLFATLAAGGSIDLSSDGDVRTYPQVTLNLDRSADPEAVADTVEALGYRVFSYAREFREMRRFFFFFDVALGVVGGIALLVASLGIVNTLVTSIMERRREIGILKSLGADEGYMRTLFIVESAVIGCAGSAAGIVVGWAVTRVGSWVARLLMARQGIPAMELFTLPVWVVGAGLLIGLAVSVAAGSFPASRAAAVDPVRALRSE